MDGASIMAVFGLRLPPKEAMLAAFDRGAHSPAAMVAYALLGLCWIFLLARAQRLVGFTAAIEALPELQRVQLLKQAYPSFVGQGTPSQDYIRSRQRRSWLLAFAALVLAVITVAVATIQALP